MTWLGSTDPWKQDCLMGAVDQKGFGWVERTQTKGQRERDRDRESTWMRGLGEEAALLGAHHTGNQLRGEI